MHYLFATTLSAVAMAGALILSLAPFSAIAQTPATRTPASCASTADRAIGLRYGPTRQSISDLSIEVARNQENNLAVAGITLLEGPCADDAYAFRMAQIVFKDGATFNASADGQFAYSPHIKGLTNFGGEPLSPDHPALEQAQFIMASKIDGGTGRRSLNVGLWKTSEGYLVAAFIRQDGGFSAPIELLRARQPIRSVTFFPSPDSNSGRLGLLENTGSGIALVGFNWDHSALSKTLRSEQ